MALFKLFRLGETDPELLGNLMGNGSPTDRNAADERTIVVGNHQIGTAAADVQQQNTLVIPALPAAFGRIEKRNRRNLHTEDLLAGILYHIGILGNLIGLDRDKQRFKLFVRLGYLNNGTILLRFAPLLRPLMAKQAVQLSDKVIITHRIRHRLTRLKFHHLRNGGGIAQKRRQLAQARERGLTGKRQPHPLRRKMILGKHLMIDLGKAEPLFLRRLKTAECKLAQSNSAARGEDKLCHLQVVPADVNP